MCDALRSRTDDQIDYFIQVKVPLLTSLLCITCSNEAFKLIKERHPENYRNIKDKRGERIGMFLWVFDLHNDVNRRLNKAEYTLDQVSTIYAPLLQLSTRELSEEKKWAKSPQGMDNLYAIEFQSGPEPTVNNSNTDSNESKVNQVAANTTETRELKMNEPKTVTANESEAKTASANETRAKELKITPFRPQFFRSKSNARRHERNRNFSSRMDKSSPKQVN
jgi:hypothetical protein